MKQAVSIEHNQEPQKTEEQGLESNPLAQEAMKLWGSRWVLMAQEAANE